MRVEPPDRERTSIEQSWPANVWNIGMDRLDYLGVDDKGQLYWNGQPLEVRRPLSLSFWQRIGAVAIAVSAVVGALAATASAVADWC